MPKKHHSSNRSDWITPRDPYILAVEEVFQGQICLDPASNALANTHVQAQFYFDGENADGLEMSWAVGDVLDWSARIGGPNYTHSERWNVFLNPPYGRKYGDTGPFNLPMWVPKAIDEYRKGNIDEAILLLNPMVSQKWFAPLWACPLCFCEQRIKFILPETLEQQEQPMYGNVFVYMGPNPVRFWAVFREFGYVARQIEPHHPEESAFILADSIRN